MFESTEYWHWILLAVGAAGIGVSKSGFAGVSMLHVIIFAMVFGAKASTGILLPLLIVGDATAIAFFGRAVDRSYVKKLLPPALIGVVLGYFLMERLNESAFRPLVGTIILGLVVVQLFRTWKPHAFERVPHSQLFAWSLGMLAGITTMVANAAGPIVALYLLAVSLPKFEFVGTSAWLFLIINVFKLPFSYQLGLIDLSTLGLNAVLAPIVPIGMWVGKWLLDLVPQRLFNSLLLIFTALSALKLVGALPF